MEIFGNVRFTNYYYIYFLIYAIIPLLIICSFKKTKSVGASVPVNITNAFKGSAMLIIMIHHFGGFLISNEYIIPYDDMGYLGSGVFLWFAGYGVAWSYRYKENYGSNFLAKRIFPIYARAVMCMAIIGICSCLLTSQNLNRDFFKILYLKNYWNSTQVWFFTAIIFCYLIVYFINRTSCQLISKEIMIFCCLLIWVMVCIWRNKPGCWYNTILLFGFGYIWNNHIEKRLSLLEKRYIIMLGVGCLLVFKWAYHSMWIKQTLYAMQVGCYLSIVGRMLDLRMLWLRKLGQCSLELYFIHSFIYMIMYRNLQQFSVMQSSISYYIVIIICVLGAFALNKCTNLFFKNES